jgi:hypothetical protein
MSLFLTVKYLSTGFIQLHLDNWSKSKKYKHYDSFVGHCGLLTVRVQTARHNKITKNLNRIEI